MKHRIVYSLVALAVIALMAAMTVQAPIGPRKDPLPSHKFIVEIDGIVEAGFAEVSGLSCVTDVIEYREGNQNRLSLLPGLTRCGPIVLKNGLTSSMELWEWYEDTMEGNLVRKSGSVVILNLKGEEEVRYNFHEAWPSAYKVGKLDAHPGGYAIEELVIQTEWIERA